MKLSIALVVVATIILGVLVLEGYATAGAGTDYSKYNARKGKEFLESNAKADGVVTLPSGLQYKILTQGSGKKPKATDQVRVHYRGTLVSGKEFDSSYSRGEPAQFGVNGVIRGWTEALQLMPEGSTWELYIPSELAYGERGAGRDIGPSSTLIFKVELIKVL